MQEYPLIQALLPLLTNPFCVLDCGARWTGEPQRWAALGESLQLHGFEAEPQESNRLQATSSRNCHYHPLCLAGPDSPTLRTLYVTAGPASSSLYPPNTPQINRWKQCDNGRIYPTRQNLALHHTIPVNPTTLDVWHGTCPCDPDFIKLDVQGAELDILRGAVGLLPSLVAIEVETEFVRMYEGQPLFADVDTFLRGHGFTFFNFHFTHNGHFGGRIASPVSMVHPGSALLQPQILGQLFTADAIYLRDPLAVGAEELPREKVLRLIMAAEILGQIEFAFELLDSLVRTGKVASSVWDYTKNKYQGLCQSTPTQGA